MSHLKSPTLNYHNPSHSDPNPFTSTAIRVLLGMIFAAIAFMAYQRARHRSFEGTDFLTVTIVALISGPAFRAAWAIRNVRGRRLVERHPVVSIGCGIVVFFIPVILLPVFPPWMMCRIVPVLILMLSPVVLAAFAAQLAFRRSG